MPLLHLCPRCSARHTEGPGPCPACRDAIKRRRNTQRELMRGPREPRGYSTRAYQLNRTHILNNADVCEICGQWPALDNPLTVDHIDGNTYNNALDNLRAACRRCNSGRRGKE